MALEPLLQAEFVGFDCEWKPYMREKNGNKVPRTWSTYISHYRRSISLISKSFNAKLNDSFLSYYVTNKKADDYTLTMGRTKEALSTAQFASHDYIVIAHFAMFDTKGCNPSQLVPSNLRTLLSSNDVYKLGSGVQQDANLCHKYIGIQCHGLIDLKDIHCLVTKTTKKVMRQNGEGNLVVIYLEK